jgi:hypothetical protein
MKKKDMPKKKADMPEFEFREFTPEEDKIYEEAVNKYREAVAAGEKLKDAYAGYEIADAELRSIIQADFLKILIAERHFTQQQSLDDIAKELDIPSDLVKQTHARMLQEVGITAANQFGKEFGDMNPDAAKTND